MKNHKVEVPKILYEDNHVIVVDKPTNSIVQGASDKDLSLLETLKNFIKHRDKKPGQVFLAPVHRLDRNVTGAVVFAKTSKGASRISESIKNKKVQKLYHAVIWGIPSENSKELSAFFKKSHKKSVISATPKEGYKEGILKYKSIKKFKESKKLPQGASLIEVELITGRFHQIRSQFAYIKHPLLGDSKYSGERVFSIFERPALHASFLSFPHPTKDERIDIKCELPENLKDLIHELENPKKSD